jgi:hypothetical protein
MKIALIEQYLAVLRRETHPTPPPPWRVRLQMESMNLRSLLPQRGMPYETNDERSAIHRGFAVALARTERAMDAIAAELMERLRLAPRGLALGVANMIVGPLYSAFVLVTGQTLEGEDAEVVDRVLAGVDVALFAFGSTPRIRLAQRVAQKHLELGVFRRFAERYSLQGPDLTLGIGRLGQRLEAAADRILERMGFRELPDPLRADIARIADRIPDMRTAQLILAKLEEPGCVAGGSRMRIGHLSHWVKQQESMVFWEHKVRQRTAVGGNGRFREAVTDASGAVRLGNHEELIEWTIPGSSKRIDSGLINHQERTVCVVDLAGQFKDKHFEKTQLYGTMVGALPEFSGYTVKVFELYWDEKAGDMVLRLLGATPALP